MIALKRSLLAAGISTNNMGLETKDPTGSNITGQWEGRSLAEWGISNNVGREIKHPTDSNIIVRTVSLLRVDGRRGFSVTAPHGLYVSKDGGAKWYRLNEDFHFTGPFYIHPLTGRWFATVCEGWIETGGDGFATPVRGYKILTSDDNGVRWTDITGVRGHLKGVVAIWQDPDAPNRVCLLEGNMLFGGGPWRYTLLRSVDDKYSSWTSHNFGRLSEEEQRRFWPGG